MNFSNNFILPTFISLLIILFATNIIIENYIISSLDSKLKDLHFNRRGKIFDLEQNKVVIIGISNKTLKELPPPYNQWPIARNLFAKLIKNLNESGVKVIGIDILFNEEDRYDKKNDSLFLYEIKKLNNVVLAAKLDELDERFIIQSEGNKKKYNNYFYEGDDDLIGFVNVIPDFDGIIRHYYPKYYDVYSERNLSTFSFKIFEKYLKLVSKNDSNSFQKYFDEIKLHIENKSLLINFYGPSKTFPTIELIDVLDDVELKTVTEIETGEEINTWDDSLSGLKYSDLFKDKIVLIGSIEPEDKDIYPVPISEESQMQFGNLMYGVEIHANVVQMLVDKNLIKKIPNSIFTILIFITAFLLNYLFDIQKRWKFSSLLGNEILNLIVLSLFLYGLYETSFQLFKQNYFLSVTSLGLTGVSIYLTKLIIHYLNERKQKLMIKNMFSHYVSSKIVDDLIANPQKLKLGGERKVLSILFSDITNFTTLSESIEPETLVEFMNDYFDKMSEIIFINNGTLDKFEGDAIMAFWNAPINDPNHTTNALKSALEMRSQTEKINQVWKEKLNFHIKTRIGINTGEAIVGNMGSNKKFDFTVMGDNVNISARLEAINKFYGTDIIVSENTMIDNNDKFLFRELDYLIVKGKSKPIKIYELIGLIDDNFNNTWKTIIPEFENALKFYRQRKFKEAKEIFEKILKIKPDDKPTSLYIQRCDSFIQNPPDESWEGISEVLIK
ncbi:MAG: adenylate/guanylate cyclase domain-containing protein [Ignavibacterium sp.]|nr:adenylate/guanylate cyclase domain-containing protein [Ignavibacterium sp.]MCX7611547.1 adenylate/guanylate cyclase domain-containing protein [Ignavibacterium sp.]MDW8374918.1 adenylate/guanylate cyclase domain-containing protein [Ignavibacteriales bacterium]